MTKPRKDPLASVVGRVPLSRPVLLASGTCGYGTELADLADLADLGGLIAKSVTLEPRAGNGMPRTVECPAGMLNAIGLANVGLERFCRDKLPELRKLPCAVLANVAGSSLEEYVAVVERLGQETGLAGLEINVSCPNVHAGGMEFGRDPQVLQALIAALRVRTSLPLWVKLTPNVTDIVPLAQAAEAGGADALTLINTLVGLRMDIRLRRPALANTFGGYSGPAVKPVALAMVYKAAGAVKIPIVGCGGIETAADAVEFLLAGASAVQIGTGTFREPRTAETVAAGLAGYLREHRLSLADLIGLGRRS